MTLVNVPEVEPCVTRVYQLVSGKWKRVCLTCSPDSPLDGPHAKVLDTEQAAVMSARDHAKNAVKARQYRVWRKAWSEQVRVCREWAPFVQLMNERHEQFAAMTGGWPRADVANVPESEREGLMRNIRQIEGGE